MTIFPAYDSHRVCSVVTHCCCLFAQVAPRAWHVMHHLGVRAPVFDVCVIDRAVVVGGTEGDVLVFASCE